MLVRIFNVTHIYRLVMDNYRSNQSAFMTRFRTDLRHQYGIFGGKSQTSISRNATRAGSEEGRLFSQAKMCVVNELRSGTVYVVQIAARNVVGYSPFTKTEAQTKREPGNSRFHCLLNAKEPASPHDLCNSVMFGN